MTEVRYRNYREECVDCFVYAITRSRNYRKALSTRSYVLAFVFGICAMYCLDDFLVLRKTGQTSPLHVILLAGALLLVVFSLTVFRTLWMKRSKRRMRAKIAGAAEGFDKALFLKISETELTVGNDDHNKTYSFPFIEDFFDYQEHLCIVLKNGAATVIPNRYFRDAAHRQDVLEHLRRGMIK